MKKYTSNRRAQIKKKVKARNVYQKFDKIQKKKYFQYKLRNRKINDNHHKHRHMETCSCYSQKRKMVKVVIMRKNKVIQKVKKTKIMKENKNVLSKPSKINKKQNSYIPPFQKAITRSKKLTQQQKQSKQSKQSNQITPFSQKTQSSVIFKKLRLSPGTLPQQLKLNSPAYIVCDQNLNIIADKNINKPKYIASITKLVNLMTCLQVMKEYKISMEQKFLVPKLCIKRSESSAKIREGQTISMINLIYAMIVPSGNDAAETIAIVLGGYIGKFKTIQQKKKAYIQRMKQYALKIGMKQTRLIDEKGFALNSSTPYQVTLLLHQVVQNQIAFSFLKKSVVKGQVLDATKRQRSYTWTSTNLLFSEGFYGKTSHSIDGSFGLATTKFYKDKIYYICVLGSGSESGRFSDAKYLFNHVIKKIDKSV